MGGVDALTKIAPEEVTLKGSATREVKLTKEWIGRVDL